MKENRLHPTDNVRVEIAYKTKIDDQIISGVHTVEEAVCEAYEASSEVHMPIEDYVFRVTDLTTGTSARYRIDAGGKLKILPEMN